MRQIRTLPRPDPDSLAIQVLGVLAADPERLARFLDLTGLTPSTIRQAAGEPHFAAAVLDHVLGYEPLLMEVAAELDLAPESFAAARARLSPPPAHD